MRKETLQRLIEEKEIELAGLKMLGKNLDMTTCEEKPDGKQTEKPAAEKTGKKTTAKKETSESQEGEKKSYDDMKSAELYALCCERGISSQCENRKKDTLVALLKENDKKGVAKEAAAPEKKKDAKTSKEADGWDDDDDWGEDQEEKDPYIGKDAKELYRMCVTRGLVVEKRKDAKVYADALKADDKKEKASEAADEEDEDDDAWEV